MLRSSLILLFGTFLLSSILTPPIYSAFITIWPEFPWPFSRVYDRVAMVCVLILVIIERKNFDLRMVKDYFKFREPPLALCLFALGLVLCFSSSMFVLPEIVESGFLAWDPVELQGAYFRLLREFPAALLIALLEETFFRVLLFQSLTGKWSPGIAAVFTSGIYGLVHFITPVKDWVYPGYSPLVGFYYIEAVLQRTLVPSVYLAFIGLFPPGGNHWYDHPPSSNWCSRHAWSMSAHLPRFSSTPDCAAAQSPRTAYWLTLWSKVAPANFAV